MKKFIVQTGATWLTNDDGTPDEASITEFFTSELLKQNRKNAVTFCVYNREKTDGSLIDLNTLTNIDLDRVEGFLTMDIDIVLFKQKEGFYKLRAIAYLDEILKRNSYWTDVKKYASSYDPQSQKLVFTYFTERKSC